MQLLIIGAGGLGTVLAAYLSRSRVDVTVLVKPEQARQFQRPEVSVEGAAEFRAPVRVIFRPEELGVYDYVLLSVKARDTDAAVAALKTARFDTVLSLQNGIDKNDLLARQFGRGRVLGALTYVAGALLRPGHARAFNPAATYIGELDGNDSPRVRALVAAINAAGLPAFSVPNVVTLEWYKLAVFLRTALVGALTSLDVATIAGDPALRRTCSAIAREVAAVAAAEGNAIPREASAEFSLAGQAPPDHSPDALDASDVEFAEALASLGDSLRRQGRSFYPSLAQDIMAGRPTELEATAGSVLARGERHGLPLPTLQTCADLVRGLERTGRTGAAPV